MSLSESRHITFNLGGETFLVPAHSQIERLPGSVRVTFIFDAKAMPSGIDYVIADNKEGYVKMLTSRGNEFTSGPLFDQLFVWYDYIIKR